MADIGVLTGDLRNFGDQAGLRVALENIAPYTAAAGTGAGTMPESIQLQQADQQSAAALTSYLTEVDQGMTGYRAGVRNIANVYDATEGRVLSTLNNVMPQDKGLPQVDDRFVQAAAKKGR
jgi:hypothetical protein